MNLRDAAAQALEALEFYKVCYGAAPAEKATIAALRAALAEPVQRPSDTAFDLWWDDALDGPTPVAPVSKETAQWIWNAALAETMQEPVANDDEVICPACCHQFRAIPPNVQQLMLNAGFKPPFTAPPQRKPLTDQAIWREYQGLWPFHPAETPALANDILKFARAIEAKHGIT